MKVLCRTALAIAFAAISSVALGASYKLAPYKDDLFKYPGILSSKHDGDYIVVDYNEKRDLDDRDIIPEKKTKPEYVSLDTKAVEQDLVIRSGNTSIKTIA